MTDQTQAPETVQHDSTYAAMRAVLEEIGVIAKSRETDGKGDFKYSFRGYEELLEAINPLCKRHGLLTPPVMVGAPEMTSYETGRGTVMHWARVPVCIHFRATPNPEDVIKAGPFWGEASDTSDKAAAKAQTVAWREIMFKTFNIPTRGGDYDTETDSEDKAAGRPAPAAPDVPEDVTERGWDNAADLEGGWTSLREICAMPGESGEWARAWAEAHNITKGTIKAQFLAEMYVVVAYAKKDGDWKANYTPPEIPTNQGEAT